MAKTQGSTKPNFQSVWQIDSSAVFGVLAFGALWALSIIFANNAYYSSVHSYTSAVTLYCSIVFGLLLGVVAIVFRLQYVKAWLSKTATLMSLGIAFAILLILLLYFDDRQPFLLQMLLWFCIGGFLSLSWTGVALLLEQSSSNKVFIVLVSSFALGVVLVTITNQLTDFSNKLFMALLALMSIAAFVFVKGRPFNGAKQSIQSTAIEANSLSKMLSRSSNYWRFYLTVAVYCIPYGFITSYLFISSQGVFDPIFFYSTLVLTITALVVMYSIFKHMINFRMLSSVILLLTVSIMLPMLYVPKDMVYICSILLSAVFFLFDLSAISTQAEMGKIGNIECTYAVLSGRFFLCAGVLIGHITAFFVIQSQTGDNLKQTMIAIMIVMLIAVFIFSSSHYSYLEARVPAAASTPFKAAVESIAERHQLSKREQDVFLLIAKGYNAKRVQGELYLSENTVKSHFSRIYAKLGVHSQQDAIKLVDASIEQVKLRK